MKQKDLQFHDGIAQCWQCRTECQKTLFNYCLAEGGSYIGEDRVKLMVDCIQICQTAADFMTRNSPCHTEVCNACAEVCEACAQSCAEIGGDEMERCVEACRSCADACRSMRGLTPVRNSSMDTGISASS